jgi:hypothetical protein
MSEPLGLMHFLDAYGLPHFIEASVIDTISLLSESTPHEAMPARVSRILRKNGTHVDSSEPAIHLAERYDAVINDKPYPTEEDEDDEDDDDLGVRAGYNGTPR